MTTPADPRPPLDPDRLAALGIEVVPQIGSTNAIVAERARAGAAEGLVVVTEHQTAGRGRLDRTWETPARSALTLSLLLRPERPAQEWPWLPLLTGVAVVAALKQHEVPAALKWPNDVLIGDRKAAGILAERIDTPRGAAAVVGIGLNVTMTDEELPGDAATSILLETGRAPDRTDLLETLVAEFRTRYEHWTAAGAAALRPAYLELCTTVGRDVLVTLPSGEVLSGTATDVDGDGRLVVDGTPLAAGDVVHVRRAE